MRTRTLLLALTLLIHIPAAAQVPVNLGRPQRIALLIDSSTVSQRQVTHFRAALLAFLDGLAGNPELAFFTTGGQLRIRVRPTDQRDQIRKAVEGFTADGGANSFIESMLEVDQRFLKNAPDKRPVFVIVANESNRDNEVDVERYNKFLVDFNKRGGMAHAIVIGGMDRAMTTEIAKNLCGNTGGRFERIADASAVATILKDIAARIGAADLR